MSLTSSLLIGQTALTASQVALQVAGNNMANAATPGYHRQRVDLSPIRGQPIRTGTFVGRGVALGDIRRLVDPALQARLRSSISDERSALVEQSVLSQIETILGELGDGDLSSGLSQFFNAFSELANNPAGAVVRSSVVEQGGALAAQVRSLRTALVNQRIQIDQQLAYNVTRADGLIREIAQINTALVNAEVGQGEEGALRDQRDGLVTELAGLLDIAVIEQESGALDILVNSQPVVLGGHARGLEFQTANENGELVVKVIATETQEELTIDGGTIGGLLQQREKNLTETIDDLDALASALIYEVNRRHVLGRPEAGLRDTTGWLRVPLADQTLAFNDPTNTAFAELPYRPVNGSITVRVTDAAGNSATQTIIVDLDGIDSTGAPGFADDTTMDDIRAALDAIPNLNAQITASGQLRVYTDSGFDVSFESDTSGVLAVLGINTYFQGLDARDIAVRDELRNDPLLLNVGLGEGTNETALAIAGLREEGVQSLGGETLSRAWSRTTERNAVRAAAANTRVESLATVRASLEAQEAAISGVSLDEESINLIQFQQQYQGAARFISLINDLTQALLNLV